LKFKSTYHSYASTNAFSKLVLDYLTDEPNLKDFYTHQPTKEGLEEAIKIRKKIKINKNYAPNDTPIKLIYKNPD
jgi:hypothetical protein